MNTPLHRIHTINVLVTNSNFEVMNGIGLLMDAYPDVDKKRIVAALYALYVENPSA
jgi:hypothetical protein